MNKNTSCEESTQTVRSKYFSTNSVMDESLSDFKEPKKLFAPKNAPKKVRTDKPRKASKKIRGQKDIRTTLQSKNNELESYSKDFDHVCKQAGLDVDSEQLQLAIALSKSLQHSSTSSYNPETTSSLSAKDRVGKIRSTLQEYGFKVPNIKIKTTNKRLKKRKAYKLLLTSEDAKRQIIADKYSQVLFENIIHSNNFQFQSDLDVNNIHLYNLTTNATYSILKSIDAFYVDGLLEKSTSTGNLLRNWSEIPGRLSSPQLCKPSNMNFSEIEFSQEELDIVLSGPLKSCKNIIKNKQKEASVSEHSININKSSLDNSVIVLLNYENSKNEDIFENKNNDIMCSEEEKTVSETLELSGRKIVTVIENRSCSPDLFDDEPSVVDTISELLPQEKTSLLHKIPLGILDLTASNKQGHSIHSDSNSHLSQSSNVTKKINDFMEITECVEVQCLITNKSETLKLSQNITKRKSNDFMELTSPVSPVQTLPVANDIDLTQSPENVDTMSVSGPHEGVKNKCNKEYLNASISQNHVAEVFQTNRVSVDSKIENPTSKHFDSERIPKIISVVKENNNDLTESPDQLENYNIEIDADKSIVSLDLTQSSNTSDELPFVSLKTTTLGLYSADKIIMNPKEETMNKSVLLHDNNDILDLTQNMHDEINQELQNNKIGLDTIENNEIDFGCTLNVPDPEDILDLTADIKKTSKQNSETNISFYDDFVHNHSDNDDVHEVITVDENFDKNSYSKEICLDVGDTSTQRVENPDYDSTTQDSKMNSTSNSNKNDNNDLTQNSESSEELNQSPQNKISSKTRNHSDENIEMAISKDTQSDIDLTQHSENEDPIQDLSNKNSISFDVEREFNNDATNEIEIVKSSQRCSSLGKKDDVSIDYDDICDNIVNQHSLSQQSQSSSTSATNNRMSNVSNKSKDISNCSQTSEVFVISDNELDYSMHQSKLDKPVDNFLFGGISIMNEFSGLTSYRKSTNIQNNSAIANNNIQATDNYVDNIVSKQIEDFRKTPVKHKRVNELASPQKPSCSGISTVVTPSNNQYIMKTVDVTPMPKYEDMSLEELHNALDQFGVKPFKRKRAIQLLTYIYNQTHPTVESYSDEESPCKRRKTNDYDSSPQKPSPRKITPRKIMSKKSSKFPGNVPETEKAPRKFSAKKVKENTTDKHTEESVVRLNGVNDMEVIQSNRNHEVNETLVIKEIECNPEDWVFQKREKAKVHSCRVPLHIAFHNYVSSRQGLREAILCYEPINIDDIHKDLVSYGHRYDPKDLLKFMDKRCITVKTTDNDARNQKK